MPANRGDGDVRPAEVDEADWLDGRQEADGSIEAPDTSPVAEEADEVPADAPTADVLEQRQRPTDDDAGDDQDWR